MTEKITAIDIAHGLLERNHELDSMQINKMCYLCYGWSSVLDKENPLFINRVEAWKYGPTIPLVYQHFKQYGGDKIDYESHSQEISISRGNLSEFHAQLVDFVVKRYNLTGIQLSSMTHKEGTPWSKTWKGDQGVKIPFDLIKAHFTDLSNKLLGK